MSAVAELQTELYEVQRERARPDELAARERRLKVRIAEAEEGRKAEVQLVESGLATMIPEYSTALDEAIDRYRAFVAAMERLNADSADRQELLTRARKLGLEVPAEAFDSFAARMEAEYELSDFHRNRGMAVVNSGWPR